MIIKKLELKNFLSHGQSEIFFDKGVTVIYGHNGAGKSSIIDAIKFALFGEKRGSSIADLIKRGSQEMAVSLEFSIGPHDYRITRQMNLGKTGVKDRDAVLLQDKSELARTVSSVDDAVSGILGIDKDTFVNSVFVEQGEIDTLISKTRAERENTFSRILGLTLLSQYAGDLGQLSKDTEARLQAFTGITDNIEQIRAGIAEKENSKSQIKQDLQRVETEKSGIQTTISAIDQERTGIQANIAGLKVTANNLEGKKKELNQAQVRIDRRTLDIKRLRDKFDALAREIDSDLLGKADAIGDYFALADSLPAKRELLKDLTARIEQIDKITKEIQSLEQGYKAYGLLENRLNELRSQRPALEKNEASYRSDEKRLREIEADLEKRQAALEASSKKLKAKLNLTEITETTVQKLREQIEAEKGKLDAGIQEIRASVGKMNSDLKEIGETKALLGSSAKCPLCLQPLSEEHRKRLNDEYGEKEDKLRKNQQTLAADKKKLDDQKAGLDGKLEVLNSPEVNSCLVESRYLESLSVEMANLRKSMDTLRKDHDAYSKYTEDVIETEKKMKTLRYSYDRYRSHEMTISSSNVEDLKKRLHETTTEITSEEKLLLEMEGTIDYKPDPNMRQKIREMREKEKSRLSVYQELFALTTTQDSDIEKMETLKNEIKTLEQQVSGFPELEKKFNDISVRYEEANSQLHAKIGEESSLRTRMETEESALQELISSLEKLEGARKEMDNLKNGIGIINKLRGCFDRDGIQKAIRKDSALYITNKVREYSSSFNLDFDDVNINEEMAIEVSQNGSLESIDMLSGGEKVALAIALRLALATYVMESIKTVIMDEPTTYLDEDRRSNLKDIIQYTFKGDETPVPQMIVVTHHKELGSVADNVFEITKQDGSSKVIIG